MCDLQPRDIAVPVRSIRAAVLVVGKLSLLPQTNKYTFFEAICVHGVDLNDVNIGVQHIMDNNPKQSAELFRI